MEKKKKTVVRKDIVKKVDFDIVFVPRGEEGVRLDKENVIQEDGHSI